MTRVRVVAVDDSPIFLEVLREVLEADGDIEVVAEAPDGRRALDQVARHGPDLVTLDLNMPGQDGLATLEELMALRPVPVVVLTSQPVKGARDLVYEATRRGALEVLDKRMVCGASEENARLRELARQLSAVSVVRHLRPWRRAPASLPSPSHTSYRSQVSQVSHSSQAPTCPVLALGASAGGPPALAHVLSELSADLPACVAVVQHLCPGFAESFARFLQDHTALRVRTVSERAPVEPGLVLLPPDGRHLVAVDRRHFAASDAAPARGFRPAVDVLFSSVARVHGAAAVGALLTGMGDDGARGLLELRRAGAATFAQDERTSVVFGMPRAALESGAAARAVALGDLAVALSEAVARTTLERPAP
ncbi:MAG: chemotaxis-specific protein-glutamate methyltransferase CheB [Myxococcales bacterium]